MELQYDVAFIAAAQSGIGAGFLLLGRYISERIRRRNLRTALSWSCFCLGLLFIAGAVLTML